MAFGTAPDVKKLVDSMRTQHPRLTSMRQVRDRMMDATLKAFASILPPALQQHWIPYQTEEPNDEVHTLKHLLVSNQAEVQVILKSTDSGLVKKAQDLEDGLEALEAALFPIEVQLDECEFMGDGYVLISLERKPGGEELAKFSNRDALQAAADEAAAGDAGETDESDDSPQARYNAAYADAGSHDQAYTQVTRDAQMRDGLRWRVRVIDPVTADGFEDENGQVIVGVEYGQVALNPLLEKFSEYGLMKVGDRFVVSEEGTPTEMSAVSRDVLPTWDAPAPGETVTRVNYAQVRTLEGTCILVEHMKGGSDKDPGAIIEIPNIFAGKSTGYYVLGANQKLRSGPWENRYEPPIMGLLVEAQVFNVVRSAQFAMAHEEASRDLYQFSAAPGVPPADATQETKSAQTKDGAPPPVSAGEIKRIESTGIKMQELEQSVRVTLEQFKSRELWGGTGSSGETGIHLARLQTALLTKLVPYQVKRAALRKRIMQDFLLHIATSGETVTIPWIPRGDVTDKRAVPRTITPEMARLPVEIQVTVGADTPESRYAQMQMSQQQTEFGTWSMETHMENSDVKDPAAERRRIAKDAVRQMMIGTSKEPGFLPKRAAEALEQRLQAGLDAALGPAPVPPVPPAPDQMGPVISPDGGGESPVQIAPGGAPVAPGGAPIPA